MAMSFNTRRMHDYMLSERKRKRKKKPRLLVLRKGRKKPNDNLYRIPKRNTLENRMSFYYNECLNCFANTKNSMVGYSKAVLVLLYKRLRLRNSIILFVFYIAGLEITCLSLVSSFFSIPKKPNN